MEHEEVVAMANRLSHDELVHLITEMLDFEEVRTKVRAVRAYQANMASKCGGGEVCYECQFIASKLGVQERII